MGHDRRSVVGNWGWQWGGYGTGLAIPDLYTFSKLIPIPIGRYKTISIAMPAGYCGYVSFIQVYIVQKVLNLFVFIFNNQIVHMLDSHQTFQQHIKLPNTTKCFQVQVIN